MTIDEKLKAFFEGKKVVILGFGREGRSTLKLLGRNRKRRAVRFAVERIILPALTTAML